MHINKFNCPGKIQLLPERLGSGDIKTVFHEILAAHPGPGELREDCGPSRGSAAMVFLPKKMKQKIYYTNQLLGAISILCKKLSCY